MRRTIAGESVKPSDIADADRQIAQVETHRRFLADAVAEVEKSLPALDRAIVATRGECYRAVFLEGIRRRYVCAELVSKARGLLLRQQSLLNEANAIVHGAMTAGFRIPPEAVEPLRSSTPTPGERTILERAGLLPPDLT
jgi:hypothetical protein